MNLPDKRFTQLIFRNEGLSIIGITMMLSITIIIALALAQMNDSSLKLQRNVRYDIEAHLFRNRVALALQPSSVCTNNFAGQSFAKTPNIDFIFSKDQLVFPDGSPIIKKEASPVIGLKVTKLFVSNIVPLNANAPDYFAILNFEFSKEDALGRDKLSFEIPMYFQTNLAGGSATVKKCFTSPLTKTADLQNICSSMRGTWVAAPSGIPKCLLVPPGTITYFAATTPPNGWLVADGKTYNKTEYPQLSIAINGGSNSTFTVPDLRGHFLRGLKGGQPIGEDQEDMTARHTATYSVPTHTHTRTNNPTHTHTLPDNGHYHIVPGALSNSRGKNGSSAGGPGSIAISRALTGITLAQNRPNLSVGTIIGGTSSPFYVINGAYSTLPPTVAESETRPKNVALLPCIKY